MNNNHRITLSTNKNIIVEFTNERIIPASGLTVVGALLGKSGFIKKLNRMDVTSNRSQHQIKNGDIVLTYLGMLCMGKPYFEAVHEMDDDKDFYKTALGITRSIRACSPRWALMLSLERPAIMEIKAFSGVTRSRISFATPAKYCGLTARKMRSHDYSGAEC